MARHVLLLGAPLRRGAKAAGVAELLAPLEEAMGGTIELDKNGRFYFKSSRGRMEMPLDSIWASEMSTIPIGALSFTFEDDWLASKYDEWSFDHWRGP